MPAIVSAFRGLLTLARAAGAGLGLKPQAQREARGHGPKRLTRAKHRDLTEKRSFKGGLKLAWCG